MEILIGKFLPGLLIGVFEGTIILLVTVTWFAIPLRTVFLEGGSYRHLFPQY